MNRIKLASTLTLAVAIGLPTAALASISNQRDSSLAIDNEQATLESGFFAIGRGDYVDQRDGSLSTDTLPEFSGFALPEFGGGERGSQSARFDHDADDAHRWASEH